MPHRHLPKPDNKHLLKCVKVCIPKHLHPPQKNKKNTNIFGKTSPFFFQVYLLVQEEVKGQIRVGAQLPPIPPTPQLHPLLMTQPALNFRRLCGEDPSSAKAELQSFPNHPAVMQHISQLPSLSLSLLLSLSLVCALLLPSSSSSSNSLTSAEEKTRGGGA